MGWVSGSQTRCSSSPPLSSPPFLFLLLFLLHLLILLLLPPRGAEPLQGSVEGLQVFPHVAQALLDLAGPVQNLHAAGERVVSEREGPLDAGREPPEEQRGEPGASLLKHPPPEEK